MAIKLNDPGNGGRDMRPWRCVVCGYIYGPKIGDPESRIPPGTPFSELPDDWVCPLCGAPKALFIPVDD